MPYSLTMSYSLQSEFATRGYEWRRGQKSRNIFKCRPPWLGNGENFSFQSVLKPKCLKAHVMFSAV